MALWIVECGAESILPEIEGVEIPDDWVCPVCRAAKNYLKMIE